MKQKIYSNIPYLIEKYNEVYQLKILYFGFLQIFNIHFDTFNFIIFHYHLAIINIHFFVTICVCSKKIPNIPRVVFLSYKSPWILPLLLEPNCTLEKYLNVSPVFRLGNLNSANNFFCFHPFLSKSSSLKCKK